MFFGINQVISVACTSEVREAKKSSEAFVFGDRPVALAGPMAVAGLSSEKVKPTMSSGDSYPGICPVKAVRTGAGCKLGSLSVKRAMCSGKTKTCIIVFALVPFNPTRARRPKKTVSGEDSAMRNAETRWVCLVPMRCVAPLLLTHWTTVGAPREI